MISNKWPLWCAFKTWRAVFVFGWASCKLKSLRLVHTETDWTHLAYGGPNAQLSAGTAHLAITCAARIYTWKKTNKLFSRRGLTHMENTPNHQKKAKPGLVLCSHAHGHFFFPATVGEFCATPSVFLCGQPRTSVCTHIIPCPRHEKCHS